VPESCASRSRGGEVWHDGTGWRQHRGGNDVDIELVRQARDACYALREFVETDPRWTQGRLRWDHAVALPHTELPADFGLPDCPRWKVIDRTDLPQLADRLRHVLIRQELNRPLLADTGIEQLQSVLSGRALPQRDVVARALENDEPPTSILSARPSSWTRPGCCIGWRCAGELAAVRRFWR
jgi:hypothetical protein